MKGLKMQLEHEKTLGVGGTPDGGGISLRIGFGTPEKVIVLYLTEMERRALKAAL